jgi:hypothetical protein
MWLKLPRLSNTYEKLVFDTISIIIIDSRAKKFAKNHSASGTADTKSR